MATRSAKVEMRCAADTRIKAVVEVIAAHFGIEGLLPVTGRMPDVEMKAIREKESLAAFLELIAEKLANDASKTASATKGKRT